MRIEPTPLSGAFVLKLEPHYDDRGYFARTFCMHELAAAGAGMTVLQTNISYNKRRGTLRGLHYQAQPFPEIKIVSCQAGAIWDVIVDLRPDSPTYRQHFGLELDAIQRSALFVPANFAHGFQTLTDDAVVFYYMSEVYKPDLARGVRWNDPVLGISWPLPDPILSSRDAGFADLSATRPQT